MKKLFFLLFAILATTLNAQEKSLSYAEVIQAEGKNQSNIYSALREWVATSFVSGKAVTQLEDESTGTIILKAIMPYKPGNVFMSAYTGKLNYMLKLQAKDGRFRVEMSGISHENDPGKASDCSLGTLTTAEKCPRGGMNKSTHTKAWKDMKEKLQEHFHLLTESLAQLSFEAPSEEEW